MNTIKEVVLHLGSNAGDKETIIKQAIVDFKQLGSVIKCSSFYRTEPWGLKEQDDFFNMAVLLETDLMVEDLFIALQGIEKQYPIIKNTKWGPRYLDIDILFYDNQIYYSRDLKIPHPRLHKRNFVLIPLLEIIPEKMHPVLGKSVTQLKEECLDESKVYLTDKVLI